MVNESWDRNGDRTVIDGWSWEDLSDENKYRVLRWCNDRNSEWFETKEMIKKVKTLTNYKKVGVLFETGPVTFVDWWNLEIPNVDLSMDDKRLLGKGVGYRCLIKRLSTHSEEYKSFNTQERTIFESIASELGRTTNSLLNASNNRHYSITKKVKVLRNNGWLIRKDDKTSRWVICQKAWEDRVAKEFILEMKLLPICTNRTLNSASSPIKDPRYHKILYFLPKSHKDKAHCPGRPIQAWPNKKPKTKFLLQILNPLIKKHIPIEQINKEYSHIMANGNPKEMEKLQNDYRQNFMMNNTYHMYRHLELGNGYERGPFTKGDIASMYNNIPRDELKDILKFVHHISQDHIERIFKFYDDSTLQFRNSVFSTPYGLDMGCPLSPALAQIYLQHKLRLIPSLDVVSNIAVYLDDIGIRFHPNTTDEDILDVKEFVEMQIKPLKIEWGSNDGILDVLWGSQDPEDNEYEENLRYKAWNHITWFDNNNRKFRLMLETELPTNTKINSIIQQIDRAMLRDGYTYNFSGKDPIPPTFESLIESKATFVWYAHRVQNGADTLWCEAKPSLFGDSEIIRKLGDGLSDFADFLVHSDNQNCSGCYWGYKWANWTKKEEVIPSKDINYHTLNLPWVPFLEHKRSKRAIKKILNKFGRLHNCQFIVRWKPINTNVYRVLMHKDKLPSPPKATDETRGSDRNSYIWNDDHNDMSMLQPSFRLNHMEFREQPSINQINIDVQNIMDHLRRL